MVVKLSQASAAFFAYLLVSQKTTWRDDVRARCPPLRRRQQQLRYFLKWANGTQSTNEHSRCNDLKKGNEKPDERTVSTDNAYECR